MQVMAQNHICMKSLVLHVSRWVPNANLRVPRWEEFHMGTWGRANFCHSKLFLDPREMLGVWPSPCLAKICSTLTACMDSRPPRPGWILDPRGLDGFSTPAKRRGSAEGQNPGLGPGVGKISAVSQACSTPTKWWGSSPNLPWNNSARPPSPHKSPQVL